MREGDTLSIHIKINCSYSFCHQNYNFLDGTCVKMAHKSKLCVLLRLECQDIRETDVQLPRKAIGIVGEKPSPTQWTNESFLLHKHFFFNKSKC